MAKSKSNKKQLRVEITQALKENFGNLKDRISEKKFDRNIKKASKILLAGVKVLPDINKSKKKTKKLKEKAQEPQSQLSPAV